MPQSAAQPMDDELPELRFAPLESKDIPSIITLAQRIWRAHYPGIISTEQIEYMLADRYTPENLQKLIDTPNGHFCVAWEEQTPVGFLYMTEEPDQTTFIQQLYIDPECHGQGIGHHLIQSVFAFAAPHPVRLYVARTNFQAVNFYFRQGFTIESLIDTPLGGGYHLNDYIMVAHSKKQTRGK